MTDDIYIPLSHPKNPKPRLTRPLPQELQAVTLRGEGKTYEAIGVVMGISRARVQQRLIQGYVNLKLRPDHPDHWRAEDLDDKKLTPKFDDAWMETGRRRLRAEAADAGQSVEIVPPLVSGA